MGMTDKVKSHLENYKSLQKEFCIDSSRENLNKLFNHVVESNLENLAEEFIKLCSISTDKDKFEDYLIILVKKYPKLGVKYYDEVAGYKKARCIIEKYFTRIEMVVKEEITKEECF